MEILLQILLFVFLGYSLTKCFAWACVIRRMCGGNMAVKRLHWVANISLVLHEMFSLAPLNLFARLFSSFGTITSLFPPHSLPISFFFFFSALFFWAFLLSSVEHSLIILFFKDRQYTNKLHRQRLCGLLQLCNAHSLKGSNHDNTLKICLCFGSLHDLQCLQRFVKEKATRYNLVQ